MSSVLSILFTISLIFVSLPSEGGNSTKKTEHSNVCVSTYSKCNSNKILKINMVIPKHYVGNLIDGGKFNYKHDFYLIGTDRNRDKLSNAERISEGKAIKDRNRKTDKGSRSISFRCRECGGLNGGSQSRFFCDDCYSKKYGSFSANRQRERDMNRNSHTSVSGGGGGGSKVSGSVLDDLENMKY